MVQQDLVDETSDAALAAGASTIGVERARALVRRFAELTTSMDVDAFVAGFTDDCVARFGRFPELLGKAALREFARHYLVRSRVKHFSCRKTLRSLNGNVIGVTWISEWTDAETNKCLKGRGFEFWIMRDDRIARWDAAFNGSNYEDEPKS